MRAPVKAVVEKALKLDEHGRAEVVEVLLKSLEVEDREEEADFVAELDRRAAELEAGTVRGIPWEELWAELQHERGGSRTPPYIPESNIVKDPFIERRRIVDFGEILVERFPRS